MLSSVFRNFRLFVVQVSGKCLLDVKVLLAGNRVEALPVINFVLSFNRLAKEIEAKEKMEARKEKRQKNIAKSRKKDD